jgi:hypothetical protein
MMKIKLLYFFLSIFCLNAHAEEVKKVTPIRSLHSLEAQRLIILAPPIINPHNFSFEFGFLTQKKLESFNYHYNTFAKVFFAEEYNASEEDLRSAALGAKVGLLLPLTSWFPLFFELGFGYAKTVLHHRPWFGRKSQSRESKDMPLAEGGVLFVFTNGLLLRGTWQANNVDYFQKKFFFSFGYSF